ncbi:MAG: hypothetical protein M1825_000939 [Sarcosagium campestre]|nr:MAG: hypothetical protein M1825_000939 [Sarcosagium campestre]
MLALTGCTGKLGGAVLREILDRSLVVPDSLVICTSSDPNDARWESLKAKGTLVRQYNFDDLTSMVEAFSGCSKLLLVSSTDISLDHNNPPFGQGRERHHIDAIKGAQAAGVKHVYYTSLAFGAESDAVVMRAHSRTEEFLKSLSEMTYTAIREGVYEESWPQYFGYYDPKGDERKEIVVAGDGPISWTSIADLGLATALVVAEPSAKYVNQTFNLSASTSATLKDIASIVSQVRNDEVKLKIVSPDDYRRFYTDNGKNSKHVEWWVSTYAALEKKECLIKDGTFEDLLSGISVKPKAFEATVREVLSG